MPRQAGSLLVVGLKRPLIGRNAFVEIEGEDYDGQSGATKESSNDTTLGQSIAGTSGSYVYFENVDFSDASASAVQLRVAAQSDTSLELRGNSQTGPLLGTCAVTATDGAWATQTCPLAQTTGVHALYVTFDNDSGASLVDAVAASCAVPGVWPPSDVNGRLFVDGGVRSPANVDVVGRQAGSYDRVVVVAPLTVSFRRDTSVRAQLAGLPGNPRTILVSPDEQAKQAIGNNVLDPARRADSARAGRTQAGDVAAQVEAVWN